MLAPWCGSRSTRAISRRSRRWPRASTPASTSTAVLEEAIAVCAELTRCQGALVYLWDDEQERLVVRGAIEGYTEWIGRFSLGMGEGLTGWTALTRQAGIITERRAGGCPLPVRARPERRALPVGGDGARGGPFRPAAGGADPAHRGAARVQRVRRDDAGDDRQPRRRRGRERPAARAGAAQRGGVPAAGRPLAADDRRPAPRETMHRLAMADLELLDGSLAAVLRLDPGRDRLLVEAWAASDQARLGGEPIAATGAWARLLGGGPASIALDDAPELALHPRCALPVRRAGRPGGAAHRRAALLLRASGVVARRATTPS